MLAVEDVQAVANGGNYSMPLPPASFWRLYWNTIAGWAERAWSAVLAVGAFFAAVGRWLVDAAIGIAYGLATRNWTYFKNNVVEPFRKALEAFIKFVVDLVTATLHALVDTLLKPLLTPLQSVASRIVAGMKQALNIDPPLETTLTSLFIEGLPVFLFAATAILLIMSGVGL